MPHKPAINLTAAAILNAGTINDALDRSPALRSVARWMLEAVAPMMGR